MSRFLIALTVLSILVMAQSVVAITPVPTLSMEREAVHEGSALATAQPEMAAIGGVPEPHMIFMLMLGLSGLAAASNRTPQTRETVES